MSVTLATANYTQFEKVFSLLRRILGLDTINRLKTCGYWVK
jgi:hypothetical protein